LRLGHRARQDRLRSKSADELNNNDLIRRFYLGM
jgi:hypothetical protein